MNPFVFLLLLLCVALPVSAADWALIHTTPEGDQYSYDRSKLTLSGNEITYWKKAQFKTPHPYRGQMAASVLYRERIHCTEHTVKTLNHLVHAPGGAVIEHVTSETEAIAIIPESVGDLFERVLCPLIPPRREDEPRAPEKAPEPAKIEPTEPTPYNTSPMRTLPESL